MRLEASPRARIGNSVWLPRDAVAGPFRLSENRGHSRRPRSTQSIGLEAGFEVINRYMVKDLLVCISIGQSIQMMRGDLLG